MPDPNPWFAIYLPLASTVVVAAATVVLVFLTSRYVRLTSHLVEETRKSRSPAVGIDFESPDGSLRLVIANYGQSPARNVRFTVLKDVPWTPWGQEKPGLAALDPIKNGISHIAPSQKLKYFFGSLDWKNNKNEPMSVSVHIAYSDDTGKGYEHIADFDFGQLREVLFESYKDPGLAVAEAISEAERHRTSHGYTRKMFARMGRRPRKPCPMCAEMIPEQALKCSHCHEIFKKA